jgi:putative PIN family toxin of toxin-antitoxin system
MKADACLVIDTSVLISRLLLPHSAIADAVRYAADHCKLLASEATIAELAEVIGKSKFDRYVSIEERRRFCFEEYFGIVEWVDVKPTFKLCRDTSDDKFLDLAAQGHADYLITSDSDLLELHPFQEIAIITPATFLKL